jgi:hypothetical protein
MSPLRSGLVIASMLLMLLPGCGSSGGSAPASEASQGGKSPKQVMADLQRDLAKVKSYHVEETETTKGAITTMSGDVLASGAASLVVSERGYSARMIILPKAVYLKGNASYWKATAGAAGSLLARKVANRWVAVPASAAASVTPSLARFSPKHLAACAMAGTGTVSSHGVTTIGGRRAIELEDKGDLPGTSPGLLYVAADGPVLPLREVQTGPRRPGGRPDPRCDEPDDHSSSGVVTFSRFDAISEIVASPGALSIDQLGTAGGVA